MSTRTLKIKIPSLIISEMEQHYNNYNGMVQDVMNKIDSYNNRHPSDKIQMPYRGKTKRKTIKHIHTARYVIGNVPTIQLCIEEYEDGQGDMYIEKRGEHLSVLSQDKVGSSKNYALLYPFIENRDGISFCKWLVLIYATPDKDDSDIINTVKIVVTKVLGFLFKYVLPTNVNGNRIVPKLEVKYTTIRNIDNEQLDLRNKLLSAKETNVRSIEYENLSMDEAQGLIDNHEGIGQFCKRKIKIFLDPNNKKSYKTISTKRNENGEISDVVVANYSYPIEVEDAREETLYDQRRMKERFVEVIANYLRNGE